MSLSLDEVNTIHELKPDWPRTWARLCSILLGTPDAAGRLVAAVKSLPIRWPGGETDHDDFISDLLESYRRRAAKGTLLTSFDPERGGIEDFLCSRKVLRWRALRFLERRAVRFPRDDFHGDEVGATAGNETPPRAPMEMSNEFHERIAIFDWTLGNLPLQLSARDRQKPTRVAQQAGLQLYPRVDWGDDVYRALHQHLASAVHPASPSADPYATLSAAHANAARVWRSRILDVAKKIDNEGRGVSEVARERLERRRAKWFFNEIFQPLKVPMLVKLLRITPNDAAARRRRYRNALPRLLAGLRAHHEVLSEQREAARGRKST